MPARTHDLSDLVDARLSEVVTERAWPGLAAVVIRDGQVVQRTWGCADVATGAPVTPQTGFRIGSTGKTLTALALMALVERGDVQLSDDVRAHVTGFPFTSPDGEPIRLLHLVTHTSGMGEIREWRDLTRPRGGIALRPGEMP